jgi:surface polysaccharide O-acyltransferase-like enzyme
MTIPLDRALDWRVPEQAVARARDGVIDTMRGVAILMVIGIHALHAPAGSAWATLVDAALRSCVPVFLFTSGYLTARSATVPLVKRLKSVLVPYAIAFVAAYAYMASQNPAMDHRPLTTLARFGLGYVFVYYYVFVYAGCTATLWIVFRLAPPASRKPHLIFWLLVAIGAGLVAGAYLDPLLARFGLSEAVIEEARLRDLPFWFGFGALGALIGLFGVTPTLCRLRWPMLATAASACTVYALIRVFSIGDAAAYDSMAFFAYAALFCLSLLAWAPNSAALGFVGSGSYFIYLWHIFVITALRDHTALGSAGLLVGSLAIYAVTGATSIALLIALRRIGSPVLSRWLGA